MVARPPHTAPHGRAVQITWLVISGKTNTVTATVPVGAAPGGAATNPLTNSAYVTNFGDNTASVISG